MKAVIYALALVGLAVLLSSCALGQPSLETDIRLNKAQDGSWDGRYKSPKNQNVTYEKYNDRGQLLERLHIESVTPETMIKSAYENATAQFQQVNEFFHTVIDLAAKMGLNFAAPGLGALVPNSQPRQPQPTPSP